MILLHFLFLINVAAGVDQGADPAAPNKIPPVADRPAAGKQGEQVAILGGLSKTKVETDEPVRFWVTIHNGTGGTMRNVELVPSGLAGYEISKRCWIPRDAHSCLGAVDGPQIAAGGSSDNFLLERIEAGGTVAIWGELTASERHERQGLDLSVRWNGDPGASGLSLQLVKLGDIASTNCVDAFAGIWGWTQNFLKDLGLPVLLTILAFKFKRWDDAREVKRTAAEKKRDEEKAEADRERQHLLQTWNQMLTASYKNATSYYMPLLSAAKTAAGQLTVCSKGDQNQPPNPDLWAEKLRQGLFYYLLMRRRNRRLTEECGGLYFKDRIGEELAIECWQRAQDRYMMRDDAIDVNLKKHFSALLNCVGHNELLAPFLERFAKAISASTAIASAPAAAVAATGALAVNTPVEFPSESCQYVFEGFKEWVKSDHCREAIQYLDAFVAVLGVEIDRPHKYWYPANQGLKLDKRDHIGKVLREIGESKEIEERWQGWKTDVTDYINRSW